MLRRALELVSRHIILTRQLPKEFGGLSLYVTPDASLKYWRRDISKVDAWLLSMARELVKRSDVVWDIGANVGLFTFAAAGLGARVLAVEPDEQLSSLIRRSAKTNQSTVEVLTLAISDKMGVGSFHIAKRGRATNHLGETISTQTGGTRETRLIETSTLDHLLDLFSAPNVIKIDVEGAEADALRGAQEVLSRHPRILIEVADCRSDEVTMILKEQGYKLFNAETGEPIEKAVWNTLAIH